MFWRKPAEKEVRKASDDAKEMISQIESELKVLNIDLEDSKTYSDPNLNKYESSVKAEVLRNIAPLYIDLYKLVKRFRKRFEKNIETRLGKISFVKDVLERNIKENS